jgi:uncharacterized protein YbjT (DUF2867 family)
MIKSIDLPKVLVAGATGYLGGFVVESLQRKGYPVRALARDPRKLGRRRQLCEEVVVAEATRPDTLSDLAGGAKVLFSCLGKHDFKRKPTVWEVDFQANMNLLEASRAQGVEHVVFVSVVNGPLLRRRGIETAEARERVVDAIEASGLTWTILRPSGFFNDMEDFFKMAVKGTGWVIGDGSAPMSPIHGADLAEFVVDKMGDLGARGCAFDVGGPDTLTYDEIMGLAFKALGKPPKLRRVPNWVITSGAALTALFNPMVADLIRAIYAMSTEGASAPNYGHHHLADFFASLAAGRKADGSGPGRA